MRRGGGEGGEERVLELCGGAWGGRLTVGNFIVQCENFFSIFVMRFLDHFARTPPGNSPVLIYKDVYLILSSSE